MTDALPYQIHLSYVYERSSTDSGNQQNSCLNLIWTLAQKTKHGFQELFADRKHMYAAVLKSHLYHYMGNFSHK